MRCRWFWGETQKADRSMVLLAVPCRTARHRPAGRWCEKRKWTSAGGVNVSTCVSRNAFPSDFAYHISGLHPDNETTIMRHPTHTALICSTAGRCRGIRHSRRHGPHVGRTARSRKCCVISILAASSCISMILPRPVTSLLRKTVSVELTVDEVQPSRQFANNRHRRGDTTP